jgi:hypothetical protein
LDNFKDLGTDSGKRLYFILCYDYDKTIGGKVRTVTKTRRTERAKKTYRDAALVGETLRLNIHTYHSRFIPEGVAKVSDIPPSYPRFTKISWR